jgi:hypothetical protein
VYTTVLDIGENDNLDIEIPYHQAQAWLINDQTIQDNWKPGSALANRLGTDNGLLTVRVLNALTAPAAGSISILFFITGADDFEYANPAERIGPDSSNRIPNFFALQADDHTEIVPSCVVVGKRPIVHPDRYGLNFGENISSLRTLLHRSHVWDTFWAADTTNTGINVINKVFKIMPYTPGYTNGGWAYTANKVVAAAGTAPYAFNYMPHMPYVSGMFLGYRGGANYTITPQGDKTGNFSDFRLSRLTTNNYGTLYRYGAYNGTMSSVFTASRKYFAINSDPTFTTVDGFGGMAITATVTNGSLVFQIPDYKQYNFSLVDPNNYIAGSALDGTDIQSVLMQANVAASTAEGVNSVTFQTEVCAAPDFTCLFFLCCPTLDFLTGNPTPN